MSDPYGIESYRVAVGTDEMLLYLSKLVCLLRHLVLEGRELRRLVRNGRRDCLLLRCRLNGRRGQGDWRTIGKVKTTGTVTAVRLRRVTADEM